MEQFKSYLEQIGYTKSTKYNLQNYVKEFLEFTKKAVNTIIEEDIVKFIEYLKNRKHKRKNELLSDSFAINYVFALNVFFRWLEQSEAIKTNPISNLKFKKPKQNTRQPLTQSEIIKLFESVVNTKQTAILHLFYSTGLRRSEAVNLNIRDIHFRENIVYVRSGKNNKRRVVPITESVKTDLENYLLYERPKVEEVAFMLNKHDTRMRDCQYNKVLKEIIKHSKLNIEHCSLHHLRHSIATHLLENGLKIEFIKEFLGHTYLGTTQIYAKVNQHQLMKL